MSPSFAEGLEIHCLTGHTLVSKQILVFYMKMSSLILEMEDEKMEDYEYEQFECENCHLIVGTGYLEKTGRIVCSKCASRQ